ncbi:6-phosphofructokinase [Irpex lacteus]|nr:6-phosphofructokinase [Irpex lacteus]
MTSTPTHRMKLAVLTSGGDSAGMNAVVRAVVKAGILKGCETWVVREGYEGLVRGNSEGGRVEKVSAPPHVPVNIKDESFLHNLRFDGTSDLPSGRSLKGRYIVRVGWDDVRGWFGVGGTLIGTARSVAFRTPEGRLTAAFNLIKEGIDALCVCGGDGSLTGADVFRAEWPSLITEDQAKTYAHLKIVGLVGSIDNDIICEAIDNIESTAASHSRAFVVEVMGRHCGWLALMAGVRCRPPKADSWADEMCEMIQKHRAMGKRKTIVIVAEGAQDKNLKPIRADDIKDVLSDKLGLDTRVTTLGHTQRGGRPCAYDRIMPTLQGVEAVDALLEATPDTPSYMIGIQENKITRVPLVEAVAMAIEEKDFETAMSLRFNATSQIAREARLPHHARMPWCPAGGMNAATRAAVRYCIRQGHKPFAVHNGFVGLLDDNVHEMTWLGVDNWMTRGGSELGTNRKLPDIDLGSVASKFQQWNFHALIMIGGFEAFSSLLILDQARKNYPSFNIPIVHLPATLSNNVPLTEFSLGSDTSLNALVDACDAIKQSASASRNRVFVVETQGGKCGYLATMGALATGINLDKLRDDVKYLKNDTPWTSEEASSVYSNKMITDMFKEEGGKLFDSRSASLGHTLQGGIPSPLDRARAVRLALKCMAFIEEKHQALLKQTQKPRHAGPEMAAVITIQGSSVQWVPVQDMLAFADLKNRRGLNEPWKRTTQLVEALVADPRSLENGRPSWR